MTVISKSNKLVTLNQQQLLNLLARATDRAVSHAPGFISANLHRGLDGTKVVMLLMAQYRGL
jgi:hypothetical protein